VIILDKHKKNNKVKKRNSTKDKKEIKRKKKKNLTILKWTTFIGIMLGGIIYLLLSPIFNINEIKITGNTKISEEEILNLSQVQKGDNIFQKTRYTIMEKIKRNTYIKEVKIKRKLPSTLYIEVTERDIAYQIEYNENYVYLDSQGYILEISPEKQNVIILRGCSTQEFEKTKRINEQDLENLKMVFQIKNEMKTINKNEQITYIDISNKEEYIIYLESERKTIFLGDGSNLKDKILNIEKILEAENGIEGSIYINGNLNEGFKPYFSETMKQ